MIFFDMHQINRLPGIPQPVKLGLAGGPLIVSILISRFGPRLHIITYTTPSANLMIREIGISLFLACVGLEAGDGFIGRYILKLDYSTLIGVLAGSCTNPPALFYASEQDGESGRSVIGYATVYPLSMFFRVLAAQLLILFLT